MLGPQLPWKGVPKMSKIFGWQFQLGWHCSQATKFSRIKSPIWVGHPAAEFFHTCNLYAPAVVSQATKFVKVTYYDQKKNSTGWSRPTQGAQHPITQIFEAYPIYTQRSLNLESCIRAESSIRTINCKEQDTKIPTLFTHVISLCQLFGRVLQYLSGWLTTIRSHPNR